MAEINQNQKRPCCVLLRELSQRVSSLNDPQAAVETLQRLSRHCALVQLVGQSQVKINLARSECMVAIAPETTQVIMDEISKTIAVHADLSQYNDLLAKLNGILAHNAKAQQLSDRLRFYLAQAREGERRFGRVPDTPLVQENQQTNALQAGDLLKAHPLLADKTQFDGIAPKSTHNPTINSEAAKNAEELQHRLQNRPQPVFNPRPKLPGQG